MLQRTYLFLFDHLIKYIFILNISRLPKGYGTRADIMNLVKDSQYVNETLSEEKVT